MADHDIHIVIAQLNFTVGDIENNTKKIIEAIKKVNDDNNADVIVFPELCVSSYPPEDLLLRPAFNKSINIAVEKIKAVTKNIHVILGYPLIQNENLYNVCSLIHDKKIKKTYYKQYLPNYSVFDEKRYFTSGNDLCTFEIKGVTAALTICEDIWVEKPTAEAAAANAKILFNINASPFDKNKKLERKNVISKKASESGMFIVYVNLVGGQDELIFDGNSMVFDKKGNIIFQAPEFEEGLYKTHIDIKNVENKKELKNEKNLCSVEEKIIYKGLVLGVKDYVEKNNFQGVVVGLSGGIDSALTLCIAVDALGSKNVEALIMPSRYTSKMSTDDARALAEKLKVEYKIISIEAPFSAFLQSLEPIFKKSPMDTTEENIQARVRGVLLMAISNKYNKLVLATGNKSEMSVGYATLYGDMAGGYSPLKDVWKTLVYQLAKWRNKEQEVIPENIINRPPTAELRENQLDRDSLPDYEILDPILEQYIELDRHPEEIIKNGFDKKIVYEIISLVDKNEYKRRQAAPGIKITERAFGKDRRYPISSGYIEKK